MHRPIMCHMRVQEEGDLRALRLRGHSESATSSGGAHTPSMALRGGGRSSGRGAARSGSGTSASDFDCVLPMHRTHALCGLAACCFQIRFFCPAQEWSLCCCAWCCHISLQEGEGNTAQL